MTAPKTIHHLVEHFEQNRDALRSGKYNEAQLRQEFLNPLFAALGWDMFNEQEFSEAYKEVIHETSVEVEGSAKAPDYAFRIGGATKFFVEAKKPSVNIEHAIHPAYQVKRYAWSAKLPLAILSDFEEFAVYDCRSKPNPTDQAATGRVMYLNYREYVEKWDEIAKIFSKDAIQKGAFDQYAQGVKGKRGTKEVDDAFLEEMEAWRELLAKNLALRNPELENVHQLNYAVQMTIDRIVFLRICEDRGIEKDGQLKQLLNETPIYDHLCALFQEADKRYNSGLFHFAAEKGQPSQPDELTLKLKIDDRVLKEIINDLYYPSPYVFKLIPTEILGQVYERFLGKVIRLTAGHQAKVEEKPEVRKAGGVYYTPTYIVDYIVKNTVGKLLEGKAPKEVAELKIVDPACGSGSFLLGAYQYLINWHTDWYSRHEPEKWARGSSPAIYRAQGGDWKLTTSEKKHILLNNIHGVDIDPQAVEVTKLSLLLKVLEGESQESIGQQLSFLKERALPDLGRNIQCGNSLIGHDYYENRQMSMYFRDEEERQRVNTFDWKTAYPQVFSQGGFDAVIGNPPYIRIQTLQEWAPKEVLYFNNEYKTSGTGNYDIYSLFMEKGLNLISQSGYLSFITGSKWFNANYANNLREIIGNRIVQILDFKYNQVFENAFVNTCILLISKNKQKEFKYFFIQKVNNLNQVVRDLIDSKYNKNISTLELDSQQLSSDNWHFSDSNSLKIIERVKSNTVPLESICLRIYQGLKTSGDKIFLVDVINKSKNQIQIYSNSQKKSFYVEPDLFKSLFRGSQIKSYYFIDEGRAILFPYKNCELIPENEIKNKLPLTYQYLLENRAELEAREYGNLKGKKWYGFGRTQALEIIRLPKIITPDLARFASFAWDETGNNYFVGGAAGGYGIILKPEWNYQYTLGLLNSTLLDYLIKSQSTQMESGFYSFESRFIRETPIHLIDKNSIRETKLHNKIILFVDNMLSLHKRLSRTPQEKEFLQREIEATNRQIDKLVYELYGLTEEEIRIVEGVH